MPYPVTAQVAVPELKSQQPSPEGQPELLTGSQLVTVKPQEPAPQVPVQHCDAEVQLVPSVLHAGAPHAPLEHCPVQH